MGAASLFCALWKGNTVVLLQLYILKNSQLYYRNKINFLFKYKCVYTITSRAKIITAPLVEIWNDSSFIRHTQLETCTPQYNYYFYSHALYSRSISLSQYINIKGHISSNIWLNSYKILFVKSQLSIVKIYIFKKLQSFQLHNLFTYTF
jgi:hypothetical protein